MSDRWKDRAPGGAICNQALLSGANCIFDVEARVIKLSEPVLPSALYRYYLDLWRTDEYIPFEDPLVGVTKRIVFTRKGWKFDPEALPLLRGWIDQEVIATPLPPCRWNGDECIQYEEAPFTPEMIQAFGESRGFDALECLAIMIACDAR